MEVKKLQVSSLLFLQSLCASRFQYQSCKSHLVAEKENQNRIKIDFKRNNTSSCKRHAFEDSYLNK